MHAGPLKADPDPARARRHTPQMFSLDFSDALLAEQEAAAAAAAGAAPPSSEQLGGTEAVAAALQLYDLCSPAEDATISRDNMEKVLQRHMGRDSDVAAVLRLASDGADDRSRLDPIDFLSYWQGIDHFFAEAGGWPKPGSLEGDMISGMRRFRDGVLEIWRGQSLEGHISSDRLLELLKEIRAQARDPQYWDDVMQAVPVDGSSLTLPEVAEAVCIWVRDCLKEGEGGESSQAGEDGDEDDEDEEEEELRLQLADEDDAVPTDSLELQTGSKSPRCQERRNTGWLQAAPSPAIPDNLGCQLRRASTFNLGPRSPAPSPSFLTPQAFSAPASGGRRGMNSFFRRGSDESCGKRDPLAEIQRASELVELVSQSLHLDGEVVNQALSRLTSLLSGLGQSVQILQDDVTTLRKDSQTLRKRRSEAEGEISRAQEAFEEARMVAEERDEAHRRANALELEVEELKEHYSSAAQELERFKKQSEEAEQERLKTHRRDLQWRDRCEQLEQAAESAEGQAKWMRAEIERQKAKLKSLQSTTVVAVSDQEEVKELRAELQAARASLRSFQGSAAESDECAAELWRQQLDGPAASEMLHAKSSSEPSRSRSQPRFRRSSAFALPQEPQQAASTVVALKGKVQMQQAEIAQLRQTRDTLVAAGGCRRKISGDIGSDDSSLSPRHCQAQNRCCFLEEQLQALVTYAQELEGLLDTTRDAQLGAAAPCPDVRRRLSVQKIQEEGMAVFNEMSENLYTLQVQKNDADQELERLHNRVVEQDGQLKDAMKQLEELGAMQKLTLSKDTLKICRRKSQTSTVASETQSILSGTICSTASASSDIGGFLSCTPGGNLQPSPKTHSSRHKSSAKPNQSSCTAGCVSTSDSRELRGPGERVQPGAQQDGAMLRRQASQVESRRCTQDDERQRERPRSGHPPTHDRRPSRHPERAAGRESRRARESQAEGSTCASQ